MLLKRSKTIIALTMAAVMSLALVGCGSTAKTSETTAPAATTGTTEQVSKLRPEGVPEDFPNKEILYIYGFGAGSVQEAYFRILADKIQKMEGWDHGFVYTFKEGASGRIGWTYLADAKPDGYTIGFTPSAMLISTVAEDVPYGIDKMSFIYNMMSDPGAIGVGKDSKYASLKDLVEDAKARPGEVSIGVTSTIGQEGLTVKLLEKASGAKFNMIAFDGEPEVLTGVVGKHLDAFCLNVTDTTPYIDDLKVLATGNTERSGFLPDVPTYKESGYDVMQVNMRGIGAPAGTPEPIRQYLENCFLAAAADPEVQAQVKDMQIPVDSMSGTDLLANFTTIRNGLQTLWDADPWQ